MAKRLDESTIITHQEFLAERRKRCENHLRQSSAATGGNGKALIKRTRLVGQSLPMQDTPMGRLEVFARLEVLLEAAFRQARELSPEQYGRFLRVLTLPLECEILPNDDQLELLADVVMTGRLETSDDEFGC